MRNRDKDNDTFRISRNKKGGGAAQPPGSRQRLDQDKDGLRSLSRGPPEEPEQLRVVLSEFGHGNHGNMESGNFQRREISTQRPSTGTKRNRVC